MRFRSRVATTRPLAAVGAPMMSDPRICREFIKGTCYRQSCQFVHSYEGDGRGGGDDRGRYGYDRGAPKPNPSIRELYPHNNDAGQGQGNKGQQPTPRGLALRAVRYVKL